MHMRSKCALSRGTRAQHMMVPQPRGWLGLLSTSTHIHTHASHTLVCATDSPRRAYERAACSSNPSDHWRDRPIEPAATCEVRRYTHSRYANGEWQSYRRHKAKHAKRARVSLMPHSPLRDVQCKDLLSTQVQHSTRRVPTGAHSAHPDQSKGSRVA